QGSSAVSLSHPRRRKPGNYRAGSAAGTGGKERMQGTKQKILPGIRIGSVKLASQASEEYFLTHSGIPENVCREFPHSRTCNVGASYQFRYDDHVNALQYPAGKICSTPGGLAVSVSRGIGLAPFLCRSGREMSMHGCRCNRLTAQASCRVLGLLRDQPAG